MLTKHASTRAAPVPALLGASMARSAHPLRPIAGNVDMRELATSLLGEGQNDRRSTAFVLQRTRQPSSIDDAAPVSHAARRGPLHQEAVEHGKRHGIDRSDDIVRCKCPAVQRRDICDSP